MGRYAPHSAEGPCNPDACDAKAVDRTPWPGYGTDRSEAKRGLSDFITAFPDLKFTTDFMVAEGDMVSAFTSVQGTHRGEFMGIPPTGKSFTVNNADTCKFTSDGLICEHWGVFDVAAMMRQLGVGS